MEKKAFEKLVKELTKHYDLDMLADRILAKRVAMYLIRISRAEAYESMVGVSEKSVFWGIHISKLDNTLRGILNDLAVSRVKRKGLEKAEQLMINIEDLLQRLANKPVWIEGTSKRALTSIRGPSRQLTTRGRIHVIPTPATRIYHDMLAEWKTEKQKLLGRLAAKRK